MRTGHAALSGVCVAIAVGVACATTASQAPTKSEPRCHVQICRSDDGGCDAIVVDGFAWDGAACVPATDSGCAAVGPDCAALYDSQASCLRATTGC